MYLCTHVHGLLEETVHEQCVSIIIFKSLGLPDGQEPTVSQYLHLIANDYPLLKLSTRGLQGDPLQRPAPHEVVSEVEEALCRDLCTNPQMLISGHMRKQLQVRLTTHLVEDA